MLKNKKLSEIIRVDHAGEYGAQVIYQGQLDALRLKKSDEETIKIVEHMKLQEDEHFEYFNEKLKNNQVRPTLMHPVWKVGGYAMGFLTALIDKKAAFVCTTAVEEVIDEHYQEQLDYLQKNKQNHPDLADLEEKITKFREEELEHRDIGYENEAAEFTAFKPLSNLIKCVTKGAIAVSKKL